MGRWSNMQQRGILRLEPSRGAAAIGGVIVAIMAGGGLAMAIAFRQGAWSDTQFAADLDPASTIALAVAGFFALVALLGLASAIHNTVRWRRARRIEKMSSDPALASLIPNHATATAPRQATIVPHLDVPSDRSSRRPKTPKPLRNVTPQANVIGRRPLNIVYLRLFDNQPRIRTFVESAWREFGYVTFLRSATAVTRSEYRTAKRQGSFASLFISDDQTLVHALDSSQTQPLAPGRRRFDDLGPARIRTRDKFGSYPVHALLCHGQYWQRAVDVLLSRVDVAVLDLSGFTDRNAGTAYELQRVIDRFPVERTVFICDPTSSKKAIRSAILDTWQRMDATSPNAAGGPRVAPIVETDRYVRSTSQNSQTDSARLVSVRRHSRRLVADVNARVAQSGFTVRSR